MIRLLHRKDLRRIVSEMRRFYLPTIEIHEVLWLKLRIELRQTTPGYLVLARYDSQRAKLATLCM